MNETIFALSSGSPPAGIGVIRISGAQASVALIALTGRLPEPRRATAASLRNADDEVLDRALVLWLPGPATVTGEDMAELHCHGGRAVIAAVEGALAALPKLRRATSGEFTRRAFVNGKIDLAEAEGLADLLGAETELQRKSAIAMAGGAFSHVVESWRERLLASSAAIEAVLDFSDEDDVAGLPADFAQNLVSLRQEIADWLKAPRAETLREGYKVVLGGPPNVGKSTLFNALVETDAAIVTPIAGTTRDVLSQSVAIDGVPFSFFDTAGLRDHSGDLVEGIGIDRARRAMGEADLVLWLGPEGSWSEIAARDVWEIEARIDLPGHAVKVSPRHRVSAETGEGVALLREELVAQAREAMPGPGQVAVNQRQRLLLAESELALAAAELQSDPLLVAENLRLARLSFDALLGRTTNEDMLDALFGRFCIGK
jgi:tRNA modification GTPase